MMVVDTSAIMATVLREPDWEVYLDVIGQEPTLLMSAGTLIELDVVAMRRGRKMLRDKMQEIVVAAGVTIVPVEGRNLMYARQGFQDFGKGRGVEPSSLNFGDCFAYGLAKAEDAPLLFKGEDFTKTDVRIAEVPGLLA